MLTAPAVDTGNARRELAGLDADLKRVVSAISKVGLSAALNSKLAELEARKRQLAEEIQAAERTVQLPDKTAIMDTWRKLVKDLGSLPKRATASEVTTARQCLQAHISTVRVDRSDKGYAEIGLPTNMVAGACYQRYLALVTALDILALVRTEARP